MLLELASSFANRFATKGYGMFESGDDRPFINDRDLENRRQVCFRLNPIGIQLFIKIFFVNFLTEILSKCYFMKKFQIDEICRPLMISDSDLIRVMSELLKAMEKGLHHKTGFYFL